jgi:Ca2+-binding RTX toxin-like protein
MRKGQRAHGRVRQGFRAFGLRTGAITASLGLLAFFWSVPAAGAATYICFGMPATIVGTHGNDILPGTPGDDVIVGRGGDDLLGVDVIIDRVDPADGGGNDRICAGPGQDELGGGAGNDLLFGGVGLDQLEGGIGTDRHFGGPGGDGFPGGPDDGADQYYGGDGPDGIFSLRAGFSGGGNDSLWGGDGDDSLFGGQGDNGLFGGEGEDLIRGEGGRDVMEGGPGDFIDVVIGFGETRAFGGPGADQLVLGGHVGGPALVFGDAGNDSIDVRDGEPNDTVHGGSGSADRCLVDPGDTVDGCEVFVP